MQENSPLFADFEPASKEKWYLKALKEMKSANADEQLIWKPSPELKIQPLYTREDLSRGEHLKNYQHGAENMADQQRSPRYWAFRQKIQVGHHYHEANAIALQALAGGA
ncbi:MAG: hypothetical protein NZ521_11645, partial [Flammeovirgaceae bacterium]|nr:hypothetical protein [Flammeovirgaceae bacterium]MDW8288850.1 hypothetical protein [Flammeovirgaceae bacterium]